MVQHSGLPIPVDLPRVQPEGLAEEGEDLFARPLGVPFGLGICAVAALLLLLSFICWEYRYGQQTSFDITAMSASGEGVVDFLVNSYPGLSFSSNLTGQRIEISASAGSPPSAGTIRSVEISAFGTPRRLTVVFPAAWNGEKGVRLPAKVTVKVRLLLLIFSGLRTRFQLLSQTGPKP